jgi:hypothetical protein
MMVILPSPFTLSSREGASLSSIKIIDKEMESPAGWDGQPLKLLLM